MIDAAIDKDTGDWLFSAIRDLQMVEGDNLIVQRVRTRLLVEQGWELDPTDGTLGSRLTSVLHLPRVQALTQIDMMVREALLPMEDIIIQEIGYEEDADDPRIVRVKLQYAAVAEPPTPQSEIQSETLEVELPV